MKRIFYLLLLISLFLPGNTALAAADSDFAKRADGMAEITELRVSAQRDKARIVLEASREVAIKTMALSSPSRVVVDIKNAWVSPQAKKDMDIDSPFAGHVRVAQFDPNTVRVVVQTTMGKNNYSVFTLTSPHRVVMDFGDVGGSTEQAQIKPKEQTDKKAKPTTVKPPADKKQEKKKPKANDKKDKQEKDPILQEAGRNGKEDNKEDESELDKQIRDLTSLKGRRIVIDPGHGGSDSGAIGSSGVTEKSVTLRVSRELQRLLEAEGATVIMTRNMDTEVSKKGAKATDIEELQARCDVANQNKADIFLSIHMDSFTNNAAKGTTVYYYSSGDKKSRLLGEKIRENLVEALGTTSRGTQSSNFYVVKHTDMPAVLIEVAFISNKAEEKLMASMKGVKQAAQGIADGIADYFG